MSVCANPKDRWDKVKIIIELVAVSFSATAFCWGVYTYFNNLEVDKSQVLYKDFVIDAIPFISKANDIARAHMGPLSRYQTIVANLPDKNMIFKDLKKKYPDKTVCIDPLTYAEKKQIKNASKDAIDLLNTKLLFLGPEITLALNSSINLLMDETPSTASPVIYFSSPRTAQKEEKKRIRLVDAYRYNIFINTNFRFLRDTVKAIAHYILIENIHTYKKMSELSEVTGENRTNGIVVVFNNLREFKRRYMAYVNWWKGKPTEECLDKNTELLVTFFEEYRNNGEEATRIPIQQAADESFCGEK